MADRSISVSWSMQPDGRPNIDGGGEVAELSSSDWMFPLILLIVDYRNVVYSVVWRGIRRDIQKQRYVIDYRSRMDTRIGQWRSG